MYRIREVRMEKGVKQAELAKNVGISAPYLFDLENGNRRASEATLNKIAISLGVDVNALVVEEEKNEAVNSQGH